MVHSRRLFEWIKPESSAAIFSFIAALYRPASGFVATSQIVLLAGIHLMSCAAVYFLVGFSAQKVLGSRTQAARVVSRVSGALMMLIAMILLLEQFLYLSDILSIWIKGSAK